MRTILVSAAVAVILALMGTPLAIWVFGGRGYRQQITEDGTVAHATKRGTPTMGGTVVVIASLVGYVVGHALTRDPMEVSGVLVLVLMTGLGLVGFAGDFITMYRRTSPGRHNGAKLAHGLDGLETGAAILVLAAYVLIFNWQLRSDCTAVLTQNCYLVRNPLDLAAVAASVLGACLGFFWWNAQRTRISIGATGTFALGGVLAGLAVTAPTELLLAAGGLLVIITLSVIRRWADR
jgi:phospho-N-acetylmuramoyl-pentapeptide-transferase